MASPAPSGVKVPTVTAWECPVPSGETHSSVYAPASDSRNRARQYRKVFHSPGLAQTHNMRGV